MPLESGESGEGNLRKLTVTQPERIRNCHASELGSIFDPGNDLRCSEYVVMVFCELVYMVGAQSLVEKKVDLTRLPLYLEPPPPPPPPPASHRHS